MKMIEINHVSGAHFYPAVGCNIDGRASILVCRQVFGDGLGAFQGYTTLG
jgi:hypothetical protein